jgi:hypothetical protein
MVANLRNRFFPGQRSSNLFKTIARRGTAVTKRTLHKAEIEKWWPIIKAANIKAE